MRNPLPAMAILAVLLIAAAGSSSTKRAGIRPHPSDAVYLPAATATGIMDLAPDLRQRNRAGSCVHASTTMLLRWQGQQALADKYWNTFRGGEYSSRHERKLKEMGIRYAMTDDGDEALIEWALATRRGCGVTWSPMHVVCLVGKEYRNGQWQAVILDNNRINQFRYQAWDSFMREWHRRGGWAFAVVYTPPPPTPK